MIDPWQEKAGISRLCGLLKVSRSGFHTARQRRRQPRKICAVRGTLTVAFETSGGSYGMERFLLNLKMERIWQRDYANHIEASHDITDDIVNFYNAIRLHSRHRAASCLIPLRACLKSLPGPR